MGGYPPWDVHAGRMSVNGSHVIVREWFTCQRDGQPSRGWSAAPLCQNRGMFLQAAPAAPDGAACKNIRF